MNDDDPYNCASFASRAHTSYSDGGLIDQLAGPHTCVLLIPIGTSEGAAELGTAITVDEQRAGNAMFFNQSKSICL
jgi:hypothetical protein